MRRSSATQRPVLETVERPEGGPGETRPCVSPGGTAQAKHEVVATLHQLIETLMGLEEEQPRRQSAAADQNRPLLLSALETAKLLSVSRSKVLDLAALGEIPSVRVGGSVRIPRDHLTAWIAEHTQAEPKTTKRLPNWVRVNRSHEA